MSPERPLGVYLETFGCQMNELDSQLVIDCLLARGWRLADSRDQADVVLYNTCSVREHAENKVHGRLGDFKPIKKRRPGVILGLLGCMAERDGRELARRYPQLDLVCGPGELDKLPLLIENALHNGTQQLALSDHAHRRRRRPASDGLEQLDLGRATRPDRLGASAYVRITRGCNKFCSYCVVPYTRGPEVHRHPDHIVQECRRLVDAGVVEITLLGQTVNHYRFDHGAAETVAPPPKTATGRGDTPGGPARTATRHITSFADLLYRIHEQVPALRRLRFVTSYPRSFGRDILDVMAQCPRICRYLHLPAQSGSDRILELMNRGYRADQYRRLIEQIRATLPDAMLASDFIVGFPTETDQDFQKTVELVRWARFKNSFIFKYSPRPGTPAMRRLPDDVPEPVKRARNVALLDVQAEVSAQVHRQQVGRVLEVLVEGPSVKARKGAGGGRVARGWEKDRADGPAMMQLSGRTGGDLIVMFEAPAGQARRLTGRIVPVRITGAAPLTLFGRLESLSPAAR